MSTMGGLWSTSRDPSEQQQARESLWNSWIRHSKLLELPELRRERVSKISTHTYKAVAKKDLRYVPEIRDFSGTLNEHNYCDFFRALLELEEAYSALNLRRFDLLGHLVKIDKQKHGFSEEPHRGVIIKGLSDGNTGLFPNDLLLMGDPTTGIYKKFEVESIKGDFVVLPRKRLNANRAFFKKPLDISLIARGKIYKYYEGALKKLSEDSTMREIIFESCSSTEVEDETTRKPQITLEKGIPELDERLKQLNEHQRLAVEGILAAVCRPKPYILFGPPGTGKTHTLIEAIVQIYKRNPYARILFCAKFNVCVEQVAKKIEELTKINLIKDDHVKRFNAGEDPDKLDMKRIRILITTNVMSGRLQSCKFKHQYQFDWVIIDEAGNANEAETLLPICSLKQWEGLLIGCLVLAGDPMQLGPVVQCEQAAKYLERSLLDRALGFKVYGKDIATNEYDSRYITKLLRCYRCDERVLAISNKLFYGDELKCHNKTPKSLLRMMNLDGPNQFCHVDGEECSPPNSNSWHNEKEADEIVNAIIRLYKIGVSPSQIGVITPYKPQITLIAGRLREKLRNGLKDQLELRFTIGQSSGQDSDNVDLGPEPDYNGVPSDPSLVRQAEKEIKEWICEINSVNSFQGNEREIIIISTVRTPSNRPKDFINDDRRFNVALSRAKWLVFVFGHKEVLEVQNNWKEFLRSAARQDVSRWPKPLSSNDAFTQAQPIQNC